MWKGSSRGCCTGSILLFPVLPLLYRHFLPVYSCLLSWVLHEEDSVYSYCIRVGHRGVRACGQSAANYGSEMYDFLLRKRDEWVCSTGAAVDAVDAVDAVVVSVCVARKDWIGEGGAKIHSLVRSLLVSEGGGRVGGSVGAGSTTTHTSLSLSHTHTTHTHTHTHTQEPFLLLFFFLPTTDTESFSAVLASCFDRL